MTTRSRRSLWLLGVLLFTSLAGCDGGKSIRPIPAGPPLADSPEHLARAIEWAFRYRAPQVYGDLLTADFKLACAAQDSVGNPYRANPWTREDELAFFVSLIGMNGEPPFPGLSLQFGPLTVMNDPRPGLDPSQHKLVRTSFVMTYSPRSGGTASVSGEVAFFAVRGDSALLPDPGPPPDPKRWFVSQWEDLELDGNGWCSFRGR